MIYKYITVSGTEQIEIGEKWCNILNELDRKEQNNNHTETRRHSTLNNGVDDGLWLSYKDENIEAMFSDPSMTDRLATAIKQLNEKQQKLLFALFYEGKTQTEYAKEIGVSQQSVSKRLKTILKKLKKLL